MSHWRSDLSLAGQSPNSTPYMVVVQLGFFAAIAEFRYFYDMTIIYISEPNHLLYHKSKVALAFFERHMNAMLWKHNFKSIATKLNV